MLLGYKLITVTINFQLKNLKVELSCIKINNYYHGVKNIFCAVLSLASVSQCHSVFQGQVKKLAREGKY